MRFEDKDGINKTSSINANQNTKQYTISNGKEQQAPQEEEDSPTSTGEEEAATARKKLQHR